MKASYGLQTEDLPYRKPGMWQSSVGFIRSYPGAGIGVLVLSGLLLGSFLLDLPFDPVKPDVKAILQPPSATHWFGTDRSGFDVFSRAVASARRDLPLALGGVAISLLIGVPLGLSASERQRWSGLVMRGVDLFQAFPLLILTIAMVALMGNNLRNVVLAIVVINVPRFMRLVRSRALTLRHSRFVEAAVAIGAGRIRVMFRHILPNVLGVCLVQCSLATAHAIVVIASLSFLGIGISPPEPSWGAMVQAGARNIATGVWWTVLFPGLGILLAVGSLNTIADSLEAHVDGARTA